LPSLSLLPAASALAQLVTLVTGNVDQSTSTLAHPVALVAGNVAQSTLAIVDNNATITELAVALAINAPAAESNELSLSHKVRKTNVPSFICRSQ
jgi:hypothetical protein